MSAHTPGPWRAVRSATGRKVKRQRFDVRAESGAWVANQVVGGGTNDDGEANANLIAAAPDLLARLKLADEMLDAVAQYLLGANPFLGEPDGAKGERDSVRGNTAAARRVAELLVGNRAAIAKAGGKS